MYICIYIYYKYLHTCHMVTFQMLRLYTLILTITIKDNFLWKNKWFSISKYRGRGQCHNNLNCPSKKSLFLEDLNTQKIRQQSSQIPSAIRWRSSKKRLPAERKIPGSLPIPITVSELWEWLFRFPSHHSLCEVRSLHNSGILIERNPPPRGGFLFHRKKFPPRGSFLFTNFTDQEPCVRDSTTRCDGRISSWNLLHTALDQGT